MVVRTLQSQVLSPYQRYSHMQAKQAQSRGTTTMINAIKIHWDDYTDKEITFDASWPESIDIAMLQSIQSLYNPQRSTYPDSPKSAMPPQPQMITSVTARETTELSQSTSKQDDRGPKKAPCIHAKTSGHSKIMTISRCNYCGLLGPQCCTTVSVGI